MGIETLNLKDFFVVEIIGVVILITFKIDYYITTLSE